MYAISTYTVQNESASFQSVFLTIFFEQNINRFNFDFNFLFMTLRVCEKSFDIDQTWLEIENTNTIFKLVFTNKTN